MLVSIVIPCHNCLPTLPILAQNILQLFNDNIEVIFVDDGSTDGSADTFARLIPEALIVSQKKQGVAAARNAGVQKANGEFIQLLDADDTLECGKLELQTAFAEHNKLDVVYSDWRMIIVDEEGEKPETVKRAEAPVEIVEALLYGWWCPPHAYIVRREAYLDIGGSDESLINAQDFDLWIRLAIDGKKFGYVIGHFANYYRYVKQTSLSRGPQRRYWSDYEKAIQKAVRLLEQKGDLTQARRLAAANRLHIMARHVYLIDREWFRRVLRDIYYFDPAFKPKGTLLYRIAANLLGFEGAEFVSTLTRPWRRVFCKKQKVVRR